MASHTNKQAETVAVTLLLSVSKAHADKASLPTQGTIIMRNLTLAGCLTPNKAHRAVRLDRGARMETRHAQYREIERHKIDTRQVKDYDRAVRITDYANDI